MATHNSGGKNSSHNFRQPELCIENGISQPKPTAESIGMKELDCVGIPEMLALALRADGWYWRSTIIWHKPSCMPESLNGWRWEKCRVKVKSEVDYQGQHYTRETGLRGHGADISNRSKGIGIAEYQDCPGCPKCSPNDGLVLRKGAWRPTNDYEVILMLTKTGSYYADREAVVVPYTAPLDRWGGDTLKANGDSRWDEGTGQSFYRDRDMRPNLNGRNLRSVWSFSSEASPTFRKDGKRLEHFAAFPERLPELCIMASTPEVGVCAKCGAPWARVVERNAKKYNPSTSYTADTPNNRNGTGLSTLHTDNDDVSYQTLGWKPTCKCGCDEKVGALVLDPFAGTGTSLSVAKRLGRRSVGFELSLDYAEMSKQRIERETGRLI